MQSASLFAIVGVLAGVFLGVPTASGAGVTIDIPACTVLSATASGSTVTLNCTTTTPPPGAPVCTVTATPSSNIDAGGGSVALSATCDVALASGATWKSAGTALATIQSGSAYTATGPVGANSLTTVRAVAFTFTSCAAADSAKCSDTVASVSQNAASGTPPPSGSLPTSCTVNGKSLQVVKFDGAGSDGSIPFDGLYESRRFVSFNGGTQMAIAKFTTRSTTSENTGRIQPADFGAPTYRKIYLSETPCDLSRPAPWVAGPTTYPTIYLSVGGTNSSYANLKPNTPYYLHLTYEKSSGLTCLSGTCASSVILYPPAGH